WEVEPRRDPHTVHAASALGRGNHAGTSDCPHYSRRRDFTYLIVARISDGEVVHSVHRHPLETIEERVGSDTIRPAAVAGPTGQRAHHPIRPLRSEHPDGVASIGDIKVSQAIRRNARRIPETSVRTQTIRAAVVPIKAGNRNGQPVRSLPGEL